MKKEVIKRVLMVAMAAIMLLCLAVGCTQTAAPAEESAAPAEEAAEPAAPAEDAQEPAAAEGKTVNVNGYDFVIDKKPLNELEIACVFTNVSIPFAAMLESGVTMFAEEFGVNAYMTGYTDYQVDKQIEIIENLITKGVDGMVIAVYDPDATNEIINKCLAAGIPTVTFSSDAPDSDRLGYVGNSEEEAGYALGKAVFEAMGGKGKAIISSIATDAVWSVQRQTGVEKALEEYPDIEIVDVVNADGTEDEGYAKIENAYYANPDITGLVSVGGSGYKMCKLMKSLDIGNLTSDNPIYVCECDIYEVSMEYELEDWMLCSISQNPYQSGYKSVKQIYDFYATGDPSVFKIDYTDRTMVYKEDAQSWLDRIDAGDPTVG